MFKIFKPHKKSERLFVSPSSMPNRTSHLNFQSIAYSKQKMFNQGNQKIRFNPRKQIHSSQRSKKLNQSSFMYNQNFQKILSKKINTNRKNYTSQKSLRSKDQIPKLNFLKNALSNFEKKKSQQNQKAKISFQLQSRTSADWKNLLSPRSETQNQKSLQKSNNFSNFNTQKTNNLKISSKKNKETNFKIKNQFCTIVLILDKFQTKICYKVKKIQGLIQFLKNYVQKEQKKRNILHEKQIIAFQTIDCNLQLDYYLTLKQADGSFLNGQTIALQPIYKQVQSHIDLNSFQIVQTIGAGGFSTVYLVRFKQDGRFYAMKVIDKDFIVKNNKKKIVMNERKVMIEIANHPFLAKLYFSFQSKSHLIFVMEYYQGGQLFNILKRYRKMSQQMAKFYIIQTLLGLQEIHKKCIVYRDFKPQNIMLNINGHVCIADFGLAKPNIKSMQDRAYSFCGSPEYMPPQMILKEGHSLPVDFYCLGALLYQLVTGLPPFYDTDSQKIYQSTLTEQLYFPEHAMNLSDQLKDLLLRLLCKEQKYRIGTQFGVKEILCHPWFGKVNKQQYLSKKISTPLSFQKIEELKFNIDQMKDQNDKLIKNMLKYQKIETQVKYLKVLNGFYYDCRLQDVSNQDQIEFSKSKNSNIRFSSNVKNNSQSLALTSCTKRSQGSIEMGFMKKQKLPMNFGQEKNKKSERFKIPQKIRLTDRQLFRNLNNYM